MSAQVMMPDGKSSVEVDEVEDLSQLEWAQTHAYKHTHTVQYAEEQF